MNTLIKGTTREEREKLVKDAIAISSLDCRQHTDADFDFLNKYIEGEMELDEILSSILAQYSRHINKPKI